jgi:hypothetical protein
VGGACGTHGRGEKRVQGFGGKPEGKRPLERPRRRWEGIGSRWTLGGLAGRVWNGFTWLRIGTVGGIS